MSGFDPKAEAMQKGASEVCAQVSSLAEQLF
jgi:hypothetical protein